jgi:hypothetical protein
MTIEIVSLVCSNNKSVKIFNILACSNIPKNLSLLYYYLNPTALNSALKYRLIKSSDNSALEQMDHLEDHRMMRDMDRLGLRAREHMANLDHHHMIHHNIDRFFERDMENFDDDPNIDRFGLRARNMQMGNLEQHRMMQNMNRVLLRQSHLENLEENHMIHNMHRFDYEHL